MLIYILCNGSRPLFFVFNEGVVEVVEYGELLEKRHELLIGAVFFYLLMILLVVGVHLAYESSQRD